MERLCRLCMLRVSCGFCCNEIALRQGHGTIQPPSLSAPPGAAQLGAARPAELVMVPFREAVNIGGTTYHPSKYYLRLIMEDHLALQEVRDCQHSSLGKKVAH
eukprot:286271-Amphidinium_carterae.2